MNGLRHVNEVFFNDVEVPLDALVGEEGKGWTIAKYLLQHERFSGGAVGELKTALQRVKEIAGGETADGVPLMTDARLSRKTATTEIAIEPGNTTSRRAQDKRGD